MSSEKDWRSRECDEIVQLYITLKWHRSLAYMFFFILCWMTCRTTSLSFLSHHKKTLTLTKTLTRPLISRKKYNKSGVLETSVKKLAKYILVQKIHQASDAHYLPFIFTNKTICNKLLSCFQTSTLFFKKKCIPGHKGHFLSSLSWKFSYKIV